MTATKEMSIERWEKLRDRLRFFRLKRLKPLDSEPDPEWLFSFGEDDDVFYWEDIAKEDVSAGEIALVESLTRKHMQEKPAVRDTSDGQRFIEINDVCVDEYDPFVGMRDHVSTSWGDN